jgi:hypothetical protein
MHKYAIAFGDAPVSSSLQFFLRVGEHPEFNIAECPVAKAEIVTDEILVDRVRNLITWSAYPVIPPTKEKI